MNTQAKQLAQNSIDYIVYHNSDKVSDLLDGYGFEVPENATDLAKAIRELVRKKGRKVIKQLIELHPDKDTILKLNAVSTKSVCTSCLNDSYNNAQNSCGSCGYSNYIGLGDEYNFVNQFESYKDPELKTYYNRILKQSNGSPNDKKLAEQVQLVWNQMRMRRENTKKEEQPQKPSEKVRLAPTKGDLILVGIVFITGIIIGNGLRFKSK